MPRAVLVNPGYPGSRDGGNWARNRPPGWTSARVREWRGSSEAAAHRQWKIAQALDRRLAAHTRKHGRPGPGVMPPQLAARHAAYARARDVEAKRARREALAERRRRKKRANPPGDAAALRRRIAGLGEARERRARRDRQIGMYQAIHHRPHPRGMASSGPGGKDAALTTAQRRAEKLLAHRTRLGQRSLFERRKNPRRKHPMKLRGAKKKAFLRRMRAGRAAAARRRSGRSSSRSSRPRRRNPSRRLPARTRKAVHVAMTRLVPVPVGALVRTRNPKRKGHAMAKRRRRHSNPHRRHRRRHNPRRHHRRHRRSNPGGMGGAVKMLTATALPAAAGGLGAGLLDATVLGGRSMIVRVGGKLLAAGLGGALLRKRPIAAASFMASMIGTAAYEGGVRIAGGLVAHNKPAGMKELAGMAAEDEASLGLLQQELQGLGLLEDGTNGMGDVEPNLGDVEPNLGEEDFADIGDEYE